MDLLILGKPYPYNANPNYRGTDRLPPQYHPEFSEDSEVNIAYRLLTNESGQQGVLHDPYMARRIVQAYRRIDPAESLDVVEAVLGETPPTIGTAFLGYDVAYGLNNSLLTANMGSVSNPSELVGSLGDSDPIQPLLLVIGSYFGPKMNSNGLFTSYQDSLFFARCMHAIQILKPGYIEYGDYEPVGLWLVTE